MFDCCGVGQLQMHHADLMAGEGGASSGRAPQTSQVFLPYDISIPQPWHFGMSLNNRCAMKPANNNMQMVNSIRSHLATIGPLLGIKQMPQTTDVDIR